MKTEKKLKLLDFKLTKNLGASLFGVYKSNFTGNGMDFVKHKEYVYGDPTKNIDWKTAGKGEKLYSKVFEDERDLKVLFLIDVGASMNFSILERTKKELQEELFYSIALSAAFSGDSIGGFLYGGNENKFFDYEKGFPNVFRILNEMNNLDYDENIKDKTVLAFEYLQKRNIKNNLIFVLTDDTEVKNSRSLKLLSVTNEIIYLNIFDYFENNLLVSNSRITLKNANTKFLNISLDDEEKIQKFKDLRKEKIKILGDFLKSNKISYKAFDTYGDTFKELYLFFSKERGMLL